jgi:hypothetical protein
MIFVDNGNRSAQVAAPISEVSQVKGESNFEINAVAEIFQSAS